MAAPLPPKTVDRGAYVEDYEEVVGMEDQSSCSICC